MRKIIVAIISLILVITVLFPIVNINQDMDGRIDLDVFLIAGQSNSAYGYGVDVGIAQENPQVPDGYAFYYGDAEKPITHHHGGVEYDPTFESYSIQSMTNADGTWKIGGIDCALASYYINATNRHCLVINAGINGISILGYHNPNGEGWSYTDHLLEDCFSKIDTEIYDVNPCGLLWIQGEADVSRDVELYVQNFSAFWYSLKKDYGFNGAYLIDVRNGGNTDIAHQILADNNASIHYVDSVSSDWSVDSENMTHDTIHYNQYGKNIIGQEFVSAYLSKNIETTLNDTVFKIIQVLPIIVLISIPIGLFMFRLRRT